MRLSDRATCLIACLASLAMAATAAKAQEAGLPEVPGGQPNRLRVVDAEGKPVAGALVGRLAGRAAEVGSDWIFAGFLESGQWRPFVTDAEGRTTIDAEQMAAKGAIVVRHAARGLVGIELVERTALEAASQRNETIEISLQPECRVHGRLKSTELEQQDQQLRWTYVNLSVRGRTVYECSSNGQEFEFFVPPGIYAIEAYGTNTLGRVESFDVPDAASELELNAVDLPAAPIARLIGRPAPEIAGVTAWKNSAPLKLADLRGKYVILEFFGHWCGPCVRRMPRLFELHDRFAKRGVAIIGVHVGLEDESIDSVEKLDAALAMSRETLWNDRDIPFPVALVASERTKYAASEQSSRSEAGAEYGIRAYPSQVLVDRDGTVVGWFNEGEHVKLFEKLPE